METLVKKEDTGYIVKELVHVIMGIVMIVLGILVMNRMSMTWAVIYILTLISIGYLSISTFIKAAQEKSGALLLRALGLLVTGYFFSLNSRYVVSIITVIFGIWALFNAGVHGLELYLKFRDQELGKFRKFIAFGFDFILGFLLLFQGHQNRLIINIQMGSYIIVYGCVLIFGGIRAMSGDRIKWRLSAPVMYAALFPPIRVTSLEKTKLKHPEEFNQVHTKTEGYEISIYIHVKNFGYERFGHLDIGYNGSIYSYGNYSEVGRSKNSIFGDGILICGNEVDFIDYSVGVKNIVYQYIIPLDTEEAKRIDAGLNTLLKDTVYYEHSVNKDTYLNKLKSRSPYYSFYKFATQPYKTYNLFTTNCVMLADAILNSSDHRLFNLSGVITPGSYFSYLEEVVASKKMNITRRIHTNEKAK